MYDSQKGTLPDPVIPGLVSLEITGGWGSLTPGHFNFESRAVQEPGLCLGVQLVLTGDLCIPGSL